MRYVICHGELPPDGATFVTTVNVGIYVGKVGEELPQITAVDILMNDRAPSGWLNPAKCEDLRLTQITQQEWFALERALGPTLKARNPHFLSAPTTLSSLVKDLNETELRMITCTVDTTNPTAPPTLPADFTKRATGLFEARKKSAGEAKKYIESLGEDARALWLGDDVMHGIMTEWWVAELRPITDNVASWMDTLSYLRARNGFADKIYNADDGGYGFPGFGADAQARIDAINKYLTDWPVCLQRMDQLFRGSDPGFNVIKDYLKNPVGGQKATVAQYWTLLCDVLRPVVVKAEATNSGTLQSFHEYLLAFGALSTQQQGWITAILNVSAYESFIVDSAKAWPDFRGTWAQVVSNYDATLGNFLRGRNDVQLNGLISAAVTPTSNPMVTTPQSAPMTTTTQTGYQARCARCSSEQPHLLIDAMDTDGTTDVNSTCPRCQKTVDVSDPPKLECRNCGAARVLVHPDCLSSLVK